MTDLLVILNVLGLTERTPVFPVRNLTPISASDQTHWPPESSSLITSSL